MYRELEEIELIKTCDFIRKVNEGWSDDEKYYVEGSKDKYLIRLSDISLYESKKKEFEIIKLFNTLPFNMSRAIEIGVCNSGKNVYMVLTWVEGIDLRKSLENLPSEEQYKLGVQAGEILKEIHSLKVNQEDAFEDMKSKILRKINDYENIDFRVENDEKVIGFIKSNIENVSFERLSYKHRDFHTGNLILTPDNKIGVIDFNRWGIGDPYEEFLKIQSFGIEVSIPFSKGQIDGYFKENPPKEFWDVLAIYVAYSSLVSITWAIKFGEEEILGMQKRALRAFQDYDYFKERIPKWYRD